MREAEDRLDSAPVLTGLRLTEGNFAARLSGASQRPEVDLTIDGRVVEAASIEPAADGTYRLTARLPRQCLCDGDVAVVFRDRLTGSGLATYLVSAGYPGAEDILASVAALRAEFEALKHAFLIEAWHEKLNKSDKQIILAEVLEAVERHLREKDAHADQ